MHPRMNEIWRKVLEDVRGKVSSLSYETWFKPARCLELSDGKLVLEVPDKFFKEWFQDRLLKTLEESLSAVTGTVSPAIRLVCPEAAPRKPKQSGRAPDSDRQPDIFDAQREATRKAFFNPRYTFETFVVGSSNQFVHAACLAVADSRTPTYNPLFIYGGTGLGKTHLLHAIGNRVLEKNHSIRLCYISAEKFMNEMIGSITQKRMPQFRDKYRNMDLLLIDDIHFIGGKESTQEEFFHTFNELYDRHRQIVLSSDKMPREIPELEERLRSRFECGLIADIQLPDLETKIAILRKKAEANRIAIPDDVAHFVAGTIRSNIRELEGCLIRLGAFSSLQGREITLDMARDVLGMTNPEGRKAVTLDAIKREVAAEFGIKVADLKSKKRVKSIVVPRQVAMYIARKTTDLSLPSIGREFGGKDHTTVLHSVNKVERMLVGNPGMKAMVDTIINRVS
jgi:chromosomal replication initiator protein